MILRLILFFLLSLTTIISSQELKQESRILVARDIFKLITDSNFEDAKNLIFNSETQFGKSSDIYFLRAFLAVQTKTNLFNALQDIKIALDLKDFKAFNLRDLYILQAEILLQMARYAEALKVLNPEIIGIKSNYKWRLLRAKAFLGLDFVENFAAEIELGLNEFPVNSADYISLFLLNTQKFPRNKKEQNIAEHILKNKENLFYTNPELRMLAQNIFTSEEEKKNQLLAYRAMGGISNQGVIEAYKFGLIDYKEALEEFFSKTEINLKDFKNLKALSEENIDDLMNAYNNFSGLLYFDKNKNGYNEEIITVSSGLITKVEYDRAECNIFDTSIEYSYELPISISRLQTKTERGETIKIHYSSWPLVSSLSFESDSEIRNYIFDGSNFELNFLTTFLVSSDLKKVVYLPTDSDFKLPTELAIAILASEQRIMNKFTNEYSIINLYKGEAVRQSLFKGDKIFSNTFFVSGFPHITEEDIDGDGYFETKKFYKKDNINNFFLDYFVVDSSFTGNWDYKESMIFPFKKEWDYDGDGKIDAMEYENYDGSKTIEYSTKFSGVMDYIIKIKNSTILSFKKNGKSIPVLKDKNPKILWLGSKPFDLDKQEPTSNGIYTKNNIKYRFSIFDKISYAEILE